MPSINSGVSKQEEFNFHDMSKEIPDNKLRHQTNPSPKMIDKVQQLDRVFNFSENEVGDSPFMNGIVEAKKNDKESPKVRRNVVQLEAINGHQSRLNPFAKPASWAVAAGGVQGVHPAFGDTEDQPTTDQKFYPMNSPDVSEINDPNLCDKLHETSDNRVLHTLSEETDEHFKKCSSNGWDENKENIVKTEEVMECKELVNKSCETVEEGQKTINVDSHELDDDDFSFDPAIKEINSANAFIKNPTCEKNMELSPDNFKSTEFFFKSFVNNEENNTNAVAPVWILPPDEGPKKKSKKKKKRN